MRTCEISGCINRHAARGFCINHYRLFKKHGDPNVNKAPEQHGMTGTDEHRIWAGIKTRCFNNKVVEYPRYGGRGITMCDEWRDSFAAFYDHMGKRPSKDHSVDRINNDGDYEPNNVRWATREEQMRNTRLHSNNTSGVRGVSPVKADKTWLASIHYEGKLRSLGKFKKLEDAVQARIKAEKKYWSSPACVFVGAAYKHLPNAEVESQNIMKEQI